MTAVTVLAGGPNDKMDLVKKLNSANDPVGMVRTFPSMYQILPAPRDLYDDYDPVPDVDLWDPATWADAGDDFNVAHLKAAEARYRRLAEADPQVPLYNIVGINYPTPVRLPGDDLTAAPELVQEEQAGGDGTVEVASAIFRDDTPTYYLHEDHTELVIDRSIIDGIMEWVNGGSPSDLVQSIDEVTLDDGKLRSASMEEPVDMDELTKKLEAGEELTHAELKLLTSTSI